MLSHFGPRHLRFGALLSSLIHHPPLHEFAIIRLPQVHRATCCNTRPLLGHAFHRRTMKQPSINSFFGGKPKVEPKDDAFQEGGKARPDTKAAAASKARKQQLGDGAKRQEEDIQQKDTQPAQKLKRLKKAAEPARAEQQAMDMEGLEDVDVPAAAKTQVAEQSAAAADEGRDLPSSSLKAQEQKPATTGKVSKQEAAEAFAKLMPAAKRQKLDKSSVAADTKQQRQQRNKAGSTSKAASSGPASPQTSAAAAKPSSSAAALPPDAAEEAAEEVVHAAAQEEARIVKKQQKSAVAAAAKDKMEGVGAGALEAAVRHAATDVQSLVTWRPGEPVPYAFLADTFEAIAETSKRLAIIHLLVNTFRAIMATTPGDLLPTVYLCTNRVASAHAGIELGVGESILIKALAQATGRKEATIKKEYEESGDLGKLAVSARSMQRTMFQPAPLSIAGVFKTFQEIASTSGHSSQERKRGLINKLLVASKENETGYIMRSLQAKLRIGLAEQSVLIALGHAAQLHQEGTSDKGGPLADKLERAAQLVKQAYSECPSYDVLVPALLQHPISELPQHCHFMPGIPVRPMLAKPTTGVSEVLDRFQDLEFTCEYKYDGERAQIHVLQDGSVHIYSRNAEDNTRKYPDIVQRLPGRLKPGVSSIVLDCEAVAWDRETKKILPFQVLSTRARKDVAIQDIKVQVCVFAFDCLFLNGRALLSEPLTERRKALYESLEEAEGELMFATYKTSRDTEELAAFLNESVEMQTEGLIVKTLDGPYAPAKRSTHWLKLKKDYLEGVGDTFDVVPIGAFYGKGKRTGVFGAYLLAVYDPDGEVYQTISKLGTGFSEEQLVELADSLRPHTIPQPRAYYSFGETLVPDVWFDPVKVWEVKAADLSISPVHKAAQGLVDAAKGISIRFPRLLRVRDDKGPEDATSAAQVADMYRSQAMVRENQKADVDADDE